MKYTGLNEIRENFVSFFEEKDHLRMQSASLVPNGDKSLLLINSGMAPLKPYFTGVEVPPNKRVTTCQKCIRTGDIENVGITARHGTFFEMLGNFSFGDYFKDEIIPWSWEYVTEILKIPVNKLYVSVYEKDDETYDIWKNKIGVSENRIVRLGKDDNFWEVGLGPCGPCSEYYYDRGEEYGCGSETCGVGCDCDRYMEFWNLVFTQFNKMEDGSYEPLENPNIDTGIGLERLASIMQGVDTIFDVDTIKAIRDKVCELGDYKYTTDTEKDVSVRIITDHIRSVVFMTADGILPSNEGRGYVLRRLLRRAVMHGRKLGIKDIFLTEISQVVFENSKEAYPELSDKSDYILKVLTVEEKRFHETLEQGLEILKSHISNLKKENSNILLGAEAFRLYDTYGFPIELMREILAEDGLNVDEKAFNKELEKQRQRARDARAESTFMGKEGSVFDGFECEFTEFLGYNNLECENSKVLAIFNNDGRIKSANEGTIHIVVDRTTFYAESGGQAGDVGEVFNAKLDGKVVDTKKVNGNIFVHTVEIINGSISENDTVNMKVDKINRQDTTRNHTATHLLQKALREVIGSHVEQAGSNVTADRLRFDFTNFGGLTRNELKKVEDLVNEKIYENVRLKSINTSIDEAREMGAMALFGEKYGDVVRVVKAGEYSIELCGGTHVEDTAEIGIFKIVSETGVASGVRRIEAITGRQAREYYRNIDEQRAYIMDAVKATPENLVEKVESYIEEAKALNKKLDVLAKEASLSAIDEIFNNVKIENGVNYIATMINEVDANGLKDIGDRIKDKYPSIAMCLVGVKNEKISVVSMVTDDLVKQGVNAGAILKETVTVLGGRGGGRPNMAQGSGSDITKVDEALAKAVETILL